ncbi:hypothetical protein BEWA_041630 [Theileria equi strain WA]|uniref:Adaptor protein ClpS core domain-containing protein n=1 Tax=Theileria equi strain WA TaxID=1537102 RepID=L1LFT3_THEEQ|nr:hypothetical protein BEWA_041630 [Theileria equi strain WA]EKX74125.1 hypothetical protein BEWA_041630 [Theileria equi strain WA]|eukprot:XP_004833577.1 hypothetical protein BEWA_041630 [Theileria equi strain WA]
MQIITKSTLIAASFVGLALSINLNGFIYNYNSLNTNITDQGAKFILKSSPGAQLESQIGISGPKMDRLRTTLDDIKQSKEKETAKSTREEREGEVDAWRVVLYNDDIHNFSYVTESLASCIPQLSLAKAHLITVEAHKNGQAEILRTWKDKAETYCRDLQKCGLTVCTMYSKVK